MERFPNKVDLFGKKATDSGKVRPIQASCWWEGQHRKLVPETVSSKVKHSYFESL